METGFGGAQRNSLHGGWCASSTFDEFLAFDQSSAVTDFVVRSTPTFGDVNERWLVVVGGRWLTRGAPRNTVAFTGIASLPFIEAHTFGREIFPSTKRIHFPITGPMREDTGLG